MKSIEELKDHAWFKGIDWKAVLDKKYRAPFIPILESEEDIKYFSSEITTESVNSVQSAYSESDKGGSFQGFDFSGD